MLKRLKTIAGELKSEVEVYRKVIQDERTPRAARVLLGAAVAYALSPIDLVPDFIPVVGHLDDLVVVPLMVYAAVKIIPDEVVVDAREAVRKKNDFEDFE
jgi:uncharacterized membrane protein YkvA (DUF1232 family)